MDSGTSAMSIISPNGFILLQTEAYSGDHITSSLAIQVDGVSIVVVAYRYLMIYFWVKLVSD